MGQAKRRKGVLGADARAPMRYAEVELAWVVQPGDALNAQLVAADYLMATSSPAAPDRNLDLEATIEPLADHTLRVAEAHDALAPDQLLVLPNDPNGETQVVPKADFDPGFRHVGIFNGLMARPTGREREIGIHRNTGALVGEGGRELGDPVRELSGWAICKGSDFLPLGFSLAMTTAAMLRRDMLGKGVTAEYIDHLRAWAGASTLYGRTRPAVAADIGLYLRMLDDLDGFLDATQDVDPELLLFAVREMLFEEAERIAKAPGAALYCALTGSPLPIWMPRSWDDDMEAWTEYREVMRENLVGAPPDFGDDAARMTVMLEMPSGRASIDDKVRPWLSARTTAKRRIGGVSMMLAEDGDARFFVMEHGDDYDIVTWSRSREPADNVDRAPVVYEDEDKRRYAEFLHDVEEAFAEGEYEVASELAEVLQEGAPEERRVAMDLLERAVPHSPSARLNFGLALLMGDVVPRDVRRGLKMIEDELPGLPEDIAVMAHSWLAEFHSGKLVPGDVAYDHAKALQHRIAAAESGDADSAYAAGLGLDMVLEPQRDFVRAARFYRMAIAGGVPHAMVNLAMMILGGRIEGDVAEARRLLENALDMGDPKAELGLEVIDQHTEKGVVDVEALKAFCAEAHRLRVEGIIETALRFESMEPFVPAGSGRAEAMSDAIVNHFGVPDDYARQTVGMLYGFPGWAALQMGISNMTPSPVDAESPPETVEFRHAHQIAVIRDRLTVVRPAPEVVRQHLDPTGTRRPTLRGLG